MLNYYQQGFHIIIIKVIIVAFYESPYQHVHTQVMGHNGWILQNPYINNLYSRTCIRKHTGQMFATTNLPFSSSLVIMSYVPAVSYYGKLCDLPFTASQTSPNCFPPCLLFYTGLFFCPLNLLNLLPPPPQWLSLPGILFLQIPFWLAPHFPWIILCINIRKGFPVSPR